MSSPMRTVRRRRPKLYWAQRDGFMWPGLHTWILGRHVRILPIPATAWSRVCRLQEHPSRLDRIRLWVMPR